MRDSILNNKSVDFALRIAKLYEYLKDNGEYVMSKQIFRSGTSIGANIHEAYYAQSTKDFINKMHIALKEASETSYWLIVLGRGGYIQENIYESFKGECEELIKLLTSTIKTTKRNLSTSKDEDVF